LRLFRKLLQRCHLRPGHSRAVPCDVWQLQRTGRPGPIAAAIAAADPGADPSADPGSAAATQPLDTCQQRVLVRSVRGSRLPGRPELFHQDRVWRLHLRKLEEVRRMLGCGEESLSSGMQGAQLRRPLSVALLRPAVATTGSLKLIASPGMLQGRLSNCCRGAQLQNLVLEPRFQVESTPSFFRSRRGLCGSVQDIGREGISFLTFSL